jgi:hypothetical protein
LGNVAPELMLMYGSLLAVDVLFILFGCFCCAAEAAVHVGWCVLLLLALLMLVLLPKGLALLRSPLPLVPCRREYMRMLLVERCLWDVFTVEG